MNVHASIRAYGQTYMHVHTCIHEYMEPSEGEGVVLAMQGFSSDSGHLQEMGASFQAQGVMNAMSRGITRPDDFLIYCTDDPPANSPNIRTADGCWNELVGRGCEIAER